MTDQPAPEALAVGLAPVSSPPSWTNVACVAIASMTAIAGLVAVAVFHVDQGAAHSFADPIIVVCCVAYDARGAGR